RYMSGEYSAPNHAAIVGVVIGCMSGEGINMNQAAIADEGAGVMVEPEGTSGGDIILGQTAGADEGTGCRVAWLVRVMR
ncbi:MAG: hypothetical protein ACKPKO_10735, partial [Candidatus Fonsibacter sp.]